MKLIITTTKPDEFIDITDQIQEIVSEFGIKSGVCCVFVKHTTCGILTMEYEPGTIEDLKNIFKRFAPADGGYEHNVTSHGGDSKSGNGWAHTRANLIHQSICIPVDDNILTLGTWQSIVFVDFDSPKQREIYIKAL